MAKTTKKQLNIERIDAIIARLEIVDYLNGIKRKNKSTKIKIDHNLKQALQKLAEFKTKL